MVTGKKKHFLTMASPKGNLIIASQTFHLILGKLESLVSDSVAYEITVTSKRFPRHCFQKATSARKKENGTAVFVGVGKGQPVT